MDQIKEFIKLVETEKFEEAHEVLENDWLVFKKEGQKEKSLFYKGLINGATSIALIRRKRSLRAKTITWNAFLKYKKYISVISENKRYFYYEAINIIESKHFKYSQLYTI